MSHANISIFVPHNGCRNQCSFCNQRGITGVNYQPTGKDVALAIETSLNGSGGKKIDKREVAFFGGSFTAINKDYMTELLEAASRYVKSKAVQGIRISTRPDAIDKDILDILKFYGVTSIELGAQSMVDEVLKLNDRGHSSKDVETASCLIKEAGFELGLQMMTGLFGSDEEKDLYTADRFIKLDPSMVRVYPTVIMKGTKLCDLYLAGKYETMGFEDTVNLCAKLLDKFEDHRIRVIRLGLHSSESLKKDIVAGVWHPAFREICENKRFLNKFIVRAREYKGSFKELIVKVNPSDVSKFIGQKGCNLKKIKDMNYNIKLVQSQEVPKYSIEIEELV